MGQFGVQKGDVVATISRNRKEWATAAYATYACGGAYVPMYENQLEDEWKFVINDSGAKVVFCASDAIRNKIAALWKSGALPTVKNVISFEDPQLPTLLTNNGPQLVDASVHGDDVSSIIYTSGTSGRPKGVVLSHANVSSNVCGVAYLYRNTYANKTCLSFLPWAHAYAQTVELHSSIAVGSCMGLAQSIEQLRNNLIVLKPQVLFCVPSLFEKLYAGITANVRKQSPTKQWLFGKAIEWSRDRAKLRRRGKTQGFPASFITSSLDRLVIQKVRGQLFPNMEMAVSGGAPLDATIMEFFEALGINVYEGYGLTETSPILACNDPTFKREGSVGRALPGVHVTIRDPENPMVEVPQGQEGEICASGPNLFLRYHNLPEETERVTFVDPNGQRTLRSGDLGRFTEEGALIITGRIKEQYKLLNGKFVAPTQVETAILRGRFILQAFVHGDGLPANVAVVVPNWPTIQEELKTQDQQVTKAVVDLLHNQVIEQTQSLKHYTIPRAIVVAEGPFTVENGMATQKMSLKRKPILSLYQDRILKALEAKQ